MSRKRREERAEPPREPFGSRPFAGLEGLRDSLRGASQPATDGEPSPAEGAPPPARAVVRLERKGHGGKTATRVSGLGLDPAALEELARGLRRALGCGARVEEGELLVQGAAVERVARWLEERGCRVVRGN